LSRKKSSHPGPAEEAFNEGRDMVFRHPLFRPFGDYADLLRSKENSCGEKDWAVVSWAGRIHIHPTRRGTPAQWAWVIAHCLLHLGLDHFQEHADPRAWNLACDEVVASFLSSLKLGTRPEGYAGPPEDGVSADEEKLYKRYLGRAQGAQDLLFDDRYRYSDYRVSGVDWRGLLAEGLRQAAAHAVSTAAGHSEPKKVTRATRARDWFMTSYPLLGALASSFEIVEDPKICQGLGIQIAAVDEFQKTIYLSSAVALKDSEVRFIMAHELLHAGLRHGARCAGRDPYLWNIACDFVVNGWLIEMGVGEPPQLGVLHDPELAGLSAEDVYARIAADARRFRKRGTFAGAGVADILGPPVGPYTDLDDFYRRCLAHGLATHQSQGRGFLPLGLVEAIRALDHPPLPWDVELARWFDYHFPPLERRRTYSRPSRRQAATPDLPRPRWWLPPELQVGRTFAVVLDTSGSMDNQLLGKALGAIASYAVNRDVAACRVIFCDAQPYDQGFMTPESIAGRVQVKGRGGTTLQPALNLLEQDFPKKGPVLIITDGYCDRLELRGRPHAYLMPGGATLPFVPKGEVFYVA